MNLPPPTLAARSLKRARVWDSILHDIEECDPREWMAQAKAGKPVAVIYWEELPPDWRELIEARLAERMEDAHVPAR